MEAAQDAFAGMLCDARIFDLGRELSPSVPHVPNHAPYMHRLGKAHCDQVDSYGMSAANDVITMGTHTGTHMDGLGHIAVDGVLSGGVRAEDVQSRLDGFSGGLGMEQVAPIVSPAVVIDVPRLLGCEQLSLDHVVTLPELQEALSRQGSSIPEGGALLFRTGWGREWPHVGYPGAASPGPDEEAIRWAWDAGARLYGSDTVVFEAMPAAGLPVHRFLIVEKGAHIVEVMDLEEPCDAGVWEFVLVILPLKLRGATGSPIRPIGLARAREG
ncbi:MAG: cyclase family protein [Acidimicrobiales bacterium]